MRILTKFRDAKFWKQVVLSFLIYTLFYFLWVYLLDNKPLNEALMRSVLTGIVFAIFFNSLTCYPKSKS